MARQLRQIGQSFLDRVDPSLFQQLDALEAAARQAKLTVSQMQGLFEHTCRELEGATPAGVPIKKWLRPILLELVLRLFGEGIAPGEEAPK